MTPKPVDPAAEVVALAAFLRRELGYDSDASGDLRRQLQENRCMIRSLEDTLRGAGNELGVVGWIHVFRRTWIALVALLGAAAGYLMNDLVDGIDEHQRSPRAQSAWQSAHDQELSSRGVEWSKPRVPASP